MVAPLRVPEIGPNSMPSRHLASTPLSCGNMSAIVGWDTMLQTVGLANRDKG